MPKYPIEVKVILPRRTKIKDRPRVAWEVSEKAKAIENYINSIMEDNDSYIFSYGSISNELHIPLKDVERLLGNIGGGGSGIQVWKKSLVAT